MKKSFHILKKKPPTTFFFAHSMITSSFKGKHSKKKLGGVIPNMKKKFRGGVSKEVLEDENIEKELGGKTHHWL